MKLGNVRDTFMSSAIQITTVAMTSNWQPELDLGLAGRLPEDWIPETDVRLPLYTRLSPLTEAEAVGELEERFGTLPERRRPCWR